MELKANELRLNNLVTLNHKVREELFHNQIHAQNEYFEVLTIYSDGDILLKLDNENVELDVKEIEPIPLTEKLILKYGKNSIFSNGYSYRITKLGRVEILLGVAIITVIDYLHEFQNLNFALLGCEIEEYEPLY